MMPIFYRIGRYTQVGIACALLNNFIVIGMDRLGYHYISAMIAGYLIVTLFGYLLHATYTFGVSASPSGWLRFVSANAVSIPLSMVLMVMLCDGLKISTPAAMPITTILLFAWNFALARRLIGKRRSER